MILIYTHKITPRVRYVFKHIFTRILLIPINFTSKVEEFVAYNGPKFSYTNVALGKEFFVKSNEILFQQGIKNFGICGRNDVDKEISQLHNRVMWRPIRFESLTLFRRKRAIESHIF